MRWRTRAGDEITATLGEPLTQDQIVAGLADRARPRRASGSARCSPPPTGGSTEVRRGMPDAGGLVIATDHEDARAYAAMLRDDHRRGARPWCCPTTRPRARRSSEFATSEDRWMVAVRMVSEGVDIPRLAVGVYATARRPPLFFAQAVGRFVRARRRGETASVFLPSVPSCWAYAAELEAERDHVLDRPRREDGARRRPARRGATASATPRTSATRSAFETVEASAHFDRVRVRRRRVRHRRGARLRRGGGLPRPARPARAGPGADPAPQAPGRPASRPHRAAPAPPPQQPRNVRKPLTHPPPRRR